jgi:hypothetical protein
MDTAVVGLNHGPDSYFARLTPSPSASASPRCLDEIVVEEPWTGDDRTPDEVATSDDRVLERDLAVGGSGDERLAPRQTHGVMSSKRAVRTLGNRVVDEGPRSGKPSLSGDLSCFETWGGV